MATPNVPDAGTVGEKWATVTSGRGAQYTAGVKNPKNDWATAAANAAGNFVAAVQSGNIGTRFSGGVRSAGTQKWQRGAVDKGAARFSAGVTAGKQDYVAGMTGVLQTIASTNLPERRPRGDAANIDRVRAIADSLHQKRLASMGAGA